MTGLLISLLTLVLILISVFIVLLVLMQKTSQTGGMGAALGGGAAESAFGAETSNVLQKGTIYGIIAFFLVALGLYLLYQGGFEDTSSSVDPASLVGSGEGGGAPGASGEAPASGATSDGGARLPGESGGPDAQGTAPAASATDASKAEAAQETPAEETNTP